MARVSPGEVKQIMDGCTLGDQVINAYIISANALVTEVFTGDTEITTTLLKEIERWFTAHMISSTTFRMGSDEKLGDASITYTGKWGLGLDSTPYGQMVKQIDFTGRMGKVGKLAAKIYAIKSFDE